MEAGVKNIHEVAFIDIKLLSQGILFRNLCEENFKHLYNFYPWNLFMETKLESHNWLHNRLFRQTHKKRQEKNEMDVEIANEEEYEWEANENGNDEGRKKKQKVGCFILAILFSQSHCVNKPRPLFVFSSQRWC